MILTDKISLIENYILELLLILREGGGHINTHPVLTDRIHELFAQCREDPDGARLECII